MIARNGMCPERFDRKYSPTNVLHLTRMDFKMYLVPKSFHCVSLDLRIGSEVFGNVESKLLNTPGQSHFARYFLGAVIQF